MNLARLFDHYGTDKNLVGYTPVYDCLFDHKRHEPLNIVEIGIGTMLPGVHSSMVGFALAGYEPGGSLRAWRDYFPSARVYGVDVQPDTQFADERIATFLCDSTSAREVDELFERLGKLQPDIVIDDGSHVDRNQLATLRNFYPHLAPGGYYVIEDIHPESVMVRDPDVLKPLCDDDPFFFACVSTRMCVIRKWSP